MRPRIVPICSLCDRFVPGLDPTNWRDKPICKAFPEGIPLEILAGGFDHRQPLNAEETTFQLRKDKTPADLESWEQHALEVEKQEILGILRMWGHDQPSRDL